MTTEGSSSSSDESDSGTFGSEDGEDLEEEIITDDEFHFVYYKILNNCFNTTQSTMSYTFKFPSSNFPLSLT